MNVLQLSPSPGSRVLVSGPLFVTSYLSCQLHLTILSSIVYSCSLTSRQLSQIFHDNADEVGRSYPTRDTAAPFLYRLHPPLFAVCHEEGYQGQTLS